MSSARYKNTQKECGRNYEDNMHCHECGKEVSDNDVFCSSCGNKIRLNTTIKTNVIESQQPIVVDSSVNDTTHQNSMPQEVVNFVRALYLGIALYIVSATYEYFVWDGGLFYFFVVIPLWLIGIIISIYKRDQSGYKGARDISYSIVIFSIIGIVGTELNQVILIFSSWIVLATYIFIKLNSHTVKDWCYMHDFHQR